MSDPGFGTAFFSAGAEYFSWRIWPLVAGWLLLTGIGRFRPPQDPGPARSWGWAGYPDSWFILGFGFGFVVLALPATEAGQWLWMMGAQVRRVSGLLTVLLGWHRLSGWTERLSGGIWFYDIFLPLAMGVGLAETWSPQVGPHMVSWILGAASTGGEVKGAMVLSVYALGICWPLIALRGLWSAVSVNGRAEETNRASWGRKIPALGLMVWGVILFFDKF